MTATQFGRPLKPCGDTDPHPWHGDGDVYCLGVTDTSWADIPADAPKAPPRPDRGRAWCQECRRRVPVVDYHVEETLEGARRRAYVVTELDCGHGSSSSPVDVDESPGGESAAEAHADRERRERFDRSAAWQELHG